jgi:hypothetical protein
MYICTYGGSVLSCSQGWAIVSLFRKLNLVGQLLLATVLLLFWSFFSLKGADYTAATAAGDYITATAAAAATLLLLYYLYVPLAYILHLLDLCRFSCQCQSHA